MFFFDRIFINKLKETRVMLIPDFIKYGDTIAVTAPSDGNKKDIDLARLNYAEEKLNSLGINVLETDNVRKSIKGRSADACERAGQFMRVWKDDKVKGVISAKGGDFLMEILPYIDFKEIKENPKWFQGFSDNTGLVFTITVMCDIATIYASNFNDFAMKKWHQAIKNNWDILNGKNITQYSFDRYQNGFFTGETGTEEYALDETVKWINASGEESICMEGRLLGGCLDVLLNLVGTKYDKVHDFNVKYASGGIVWFFESFSLGSEDIERGLWQLKEAGWFSNVRGFIFGRPAFFSSFTDTSYKEAVLNALGEYNVPVVLDADIGHKPPQLTLINGAECRINSAHGQGSIKFIY